MGKIALDEKLQKAQSNFRDEVRAQFTETDYSTKATHADLFVLGRFIDEALNNFREAILENIDN